MTVLLQPRCGAFVQDGRCTGRVVAHEEVGDLLEGHCEKCGAAFAVPRLKIDPALRRQRRLERAGLPGRYVGEKFDENPATADALRMVRDWMRGLVKDSDGELVDAIPSPAFWGLAGRGKTHLLVATCWKLINEKDLTVAFWTMRGLLRELQKFDTPPAQTAWERACTVDVLALDDIGAMQETEWRTEQLADLMNVRWEARKPVLVATNYPPSTWMDMLDERTASRLRGLTFAVELAGADRREPATGRTER